MGGSRAWWSKTRDWLAPKFQKGHPREAGKSRGPLAKSTFTEDPELDLKETLDEVTYTSTELPH